MRYKPLTLERWAGIQLFLLMILGLAILVGISKGTEVIGFRDAWRLFTGTSLNESEKVILFQVRMPRVFLAGLVGAYLAMAGVVFQALLRNPLADPFILGISSGAALGAYTAIVLGLQAILYGFSAVPLLAILGGILSVWLVYQVAKINGHLPTTHLLLAGVVVNAMFSALIMFIASVVEAGRVSTILNWIMGHLGSYDIKTLGFLTGCGLLIGVGVFVFAKPLNLLTLGEEPALTLGLPVEWVKRALLLLSTLLVALAVSVSGLIGFVGIVAPHTTRMLFGPDHRLLLPASALIGASFLIIADTLARTLISPSEIPVGVITALCGGPFFLIILKNRKRYS
jgi:iron complex transport system permease protein